MALVPLHKECLSYMRIFSPGLQSPEYLTWKMSARSGIILGCPASELHWFHGNFSLMSLVGVKVWLS